MNRYGVLKSRAHANMMQEFDDGSGDEEVGEMMRAVEIFEFITKPESVTC